MLKLTMLTMHVQEQKRYLLVQPFQKGIIMTSICPSLISGSLLPPRNLYPTLGVISQAFNLRQAFLASQVAAEQKELLDLLEAPAADEARIDELVDILAASEQPFVEASIGGGPWQV